MAGRHFSWCCGSRQSTRDIKYRLLQRGENTRPWLKMDVSPARGNLYFWFMINQRQGGTLADLVEARTSARGQEHRWPLWQMNEKPPKSFLGGVNSWRKTNFEHFHEQKTRSKLLKQQVSYMSKIKSSTSSAKSFPLTIRDDRRGDTSRGPS